MAKLTTRRLTGLAIGVLSLASVAWVIVVGERGGSGVRHATDPVAVNSIIAHDGVVMPSNADAVSLKIGSAFRHPEYLSFAVPPSEVAAFLSQNHLCSVLDDVPGVENGIANEAGWNVGSLLDLAGCTGPLYGPVSGDGRFFELSVKQVGARSTIFMYMADT